VDSGRNHPSATSTVITAILSDKNIPAVWLLAVSAPDSAQPASIETDDFYFTMHVRQRR
jgi:hypothetical protein